MNLLRQVDIFTPPENIKITIIGAGGIGSWTAYGLIKTGFKKIEIWDGDVIEDHNLPNQIYNSVNGKKVLQLKGLLQQVNPSAEIIAVPEYWDGQNIETDILVIGVDNMEIRKKIIETQSPPLIIDARIGGELIRILSVSFLDIASKKYYLNTWYPDNEAVSLPCTARAIADVGFIVSGLVCNLIRKFLKEEKIIREIIFSCKDLEILKIG